MMEEETRDLRQRIDHIDDQILMLLNSRMALAADLADVVNDEAVTAQLDKDTVSRLQKINPSDRLDDEAIVTIWNCLFQETHRAQAE